MSAYHNDGDIPGRVPFRTTIDEEHAVKTTGMARKVDQLGRVVLPAEMRRTFGIGEGDLVEIFVDDGNIVLSKVENRCTFCGTEDRLRKFETKSICVSCVERLKSNGV